MDIVKIVQAEISSVSFTKARALLLFLSVLTFPAPFVGDAVCLAVR